MNPRQVFDHVWNQKEIRLGDLALAENKIRPDQLERALELQGQSDPPRPLAQILIEEGILSTSECAELLLEQEELTGGERHRRMGRFILLYPIGRGGMGVVWKAWDTRLSRAAALKMLHVDDEKERALLLREAKMAAQLSHPNILSVYEVIEHEGSPCIAMELVEGKTLDAAATGRPLRNALEWVRDAARALEYAHSKGVIHRDLKPQNLMLNREGKVVIMDFGLAKHTAHPSQTQRTTLAGTPGFMAPEQALGHHADVGPRSDIYSLGATLYALLSGRSPFTGSGPAEILMRVVSEEPITLRKLRPGIHHDIRTIVHKAMDKNPARRYASAGALADDLERYLSGEEILARPTSSLTKVVRKVRRHPIVLMLAVLTLGALAWAALLWRAEAARRRARPHLEEARGALAEADRHLYRSASTPDQIRSTLARARASVERALGEDSRLPEAYFVRAQIAQFEGDTAAADADFDRALALDPDYAPCRIRRALHRLSQRMLPLEILGRTELETSPVPEAEDVAQELERALASGSDVPEHDLAYARMALRVARKEYEEALRFSDEALAKFESEDLLRLRALVLHRLRRNPEARQCLERALKSKHYDIPTRMALARLLTHFEDWNEALRHVDIAVSLLPPHAEVWATRGYILMNLGEFERARADLLRSVEMDPRLAIARLHYAFVLDKLDRSVESMDEFTRTIEVCRAANHGFLEVQAWLNRGVLRAKLGKNEEAFADLAEAERLGPGLYEIYYNRGLLYHRAKELDLAHEQFDRSLRHHPRHLPSWSMLAKVHWERGEWEDSAKAHSRVLELDPKEGWSWFGHALCRMQQERWKEAKGDLDKAVEFLPKEADVRASRGMAHRALGNIEGAFEDVDAALRISDRCAGAYFERSYLWSLRSEWAKSEEDAGRAFELFRPDKDRSKCLLNRAVARANLKRADEAMADLEEAIRLDPKNSWAYNYRGTLLEDRDPRKAAESFERAVELVPQWWEAWRNLGRMHLKLRDWPQAERAYAKVVEIKPDYADGWLKLGWIRADRKEWGKAISAYTEAIRLQPRALVPLLRRAEAYTDSGDLENAEIDARKAIEVAPESGEAHELLGITLCHRKRNDEALLSLNRALDLDAKRSVARANRGRLFAKMGRNEEALEDLKQAVRERPELAETLQPILDEVRRRIVK